MLLLARMQGRFPLFINHLSDAADTGRLVAKAWAISGWPLAMVIKQPDIHQSEELPRWRAVEGTLAWLNWCHRLGKNMRSGRRLGSVDISS